MKFHDEHHFARCALACLNYIEDARDLEALTHCARGLYARGFTLGHAVEYMSQLQEAGTDVPEDVALATMAAIDKLYPQK